ncbi:MAG: helix-turn-helix domain-containing protein, partial [Pseudomonadota bacterium]|nr:helix-turn-helix domain-containing protein [Pseudomonadota bacterium]
GDIQRALNVPASTLSHHLAKLARVGLVVQGRRGREIYCRVEFDEMRSLIGFLTEECCNGVILEQDDTQSAV